MLVFGKNGSHGLPKFLQIHIFWKFDHICSSYNQINYRNIWFAKVIIFLFITAQALFSMDFFEKDPLLNTVDFCWHIEVKTKSQHEILNFVFHLSKREWHFGYTDCIRNNNRFRTVCVCEVLQNLCCGVWSSLKKSIEAHFNRSEIFVSYFYDAYDSLWEKSSVEVRLIHAEQIFIEIHYLMEKEWTQLRTNNSSKTFLNHWESMS